LFGCHSFEKTIVSQKCGFISQRYVKLWFTGKRVISGFSKTTKKTAVFYDSQKRLATEHAVFADGVGEPVREAGANQGALMSSFTLLRLGSIQQIANNPAKLTLLTKKEELERNIDALKYQKAALDPADYKKQLTTMLLDLARVQQELDR